MARTSKFTFPLPGRRRRNDPSNPGAEQTRIAGGRSDGEQGTARRQWDNASASGISVCISESTLSHHPTETGFAIGGGIIPEVPRLTGSRISISAGGATTARWEQESEIVPFHLRHNLHPANSSAATLGPGAKDNRDISDASSVRRRRQSGSTIVSWYDKSRVPLSISQQTSASAMAKGPPTKATTLLDMHGVMSPLDSERKKKKPARLDFSHLIPRYRRHLTTPSPQSQNSVPAPPEYLTKSPSLMSLSSPNDEAQPHATHKLDRKLSWRAAKEKLPWNDSSSTRSRPATSTSTSSQRGADMGRLQNLYEHYEQMTFREVMGDAYDLEDPVTQRRNFDAMDDAVVAATPRTIRPGPLPLGSSLRPPTMPSIQEPRKSVEEGDALAAPSSPMTTTTTTTGMASLDVDCGASISSRYTRTSRASKRTAQSLSETDLNQTSILSLSSDSEDDGYGATSAPRSSHSGRSRPFGGDERLMSNAEKRQSLGANSMSVPSTKSGRSGKSAKRASFDPVPRYLTVPVPGVPSVHNVPSEPASPMPSKPQSRLSMLSVSSERKTTDDPNRATITPVLTTPTPSIRSSSQPRTLAQVPSPAPSHPVPAPPRRDSFGVHEARVVTLVQGKVVTPATSTRSSSLGSCDQPTPPLSPASASFSDLPTSDNMSEVASPRFMAVTRQEEMLLAALRMKRARMRETPISEVDEDRQAAQPYLSTEPHTAMSDTSSHSSSAPRSKHPSTTSMNTVTSGGERRRAGPPILQPRSSSLANSHRDRHPRGESPSSVGVPPSVVHSEPGPAQIQGRSGRQPATVESARPDPNSTKRERILLFLDQRAEGITGLGRGGVGGVVPLAIEEGEPSPDLSDYMVLDNGTEDDDEPQLPLQPTPETMPTGSGNPRPSARPVATRISTIYSPGSLAVCAPPSPQTPVDMPIDKGCLHTLNLVSMSRPESIASAEGLLEAAVVKAERARRRKAVRLSAVGSLNVESPWWGDDD